MEDTYSIDAQKNLMSLDEESSNPYKNDFNVILAEGKKNKELLSVALGKSSV